MSRYGLVTAASTSQAPWPGDADILAAAMDECYRFAMDPEELPSRPAYEGIRQALEESLLQWSAEQAIGKTMTPQQRTAVTVEIIADMFHRRGIPVTSVKVAGEVLEWEIATPKGYG